MTSSPPSRKHQPTTNRLWHELITAFRFGIIGLLATATHMAVVAILLLLTTLPVLVANTLAFLTAFSVSFFGNYHWTFRSPGNPRQALLRFGLIATSGFMANMLLLAWLIQQPWSNELYAALCAVFVIPVITFLGSRFWGFRRVK